MNKRQKKKQRKSDDSVIFIRIVDEDLKADLRRWQNHMKNVPLSLLANIAISEHLKTLNLDD